jgi:hypothetical protein
MRLDPPPTGDDGAAGTAIVVTLLVLLAVGLVTDQLLLGSAARTGDSFGYAA